MRLVLLHPEVANLSCDDCEKYIVDKDWQFVILQDEKGTKAPRGKRDRTPCHKCPKISEDVPISQRSRKHAVEMTGKVVETIRFYMECRAVGCFPDDPIVRRDATICRSIEDIASRRATADDLELILRMALTARV